MPKVPNYSLTTANVGGLPGMASTPSLPSVGEQIAKNAIPLAINAASKMDEINATRAEAAFNQFRQKQLDLSYGPDGAFNRKGQNAISINGKSLNEEYMNRLNTEGAKIEQGLSNSFQREYFKKAMARANTEFSSQLMRHSMNEYDNFAGNTFKGIVATEAEVAAKGYQDSDTVAQSVQRVRANAMMEAQRNGLPSDLADNMVLNAGSMVHSAVLGKILETHDAKKAKAYFDANKDNMSTKDASHFQETIDKGVRQQEVTDSVDAVWKTYGPQDDKQAVNRDAMNEALKVKFKNDPDAYRLARTEMHDMSNAFEHSAKQRELSSEGRVWDLAMKGTGLAQIRRSPDFIAMDGKKQAQTLASIEDFYNRNRSGKGDSATLQQYANYWAYASNPAKLQTMQDAEIFALTPVVGMANMKDLLEQKQKLGRGETSKVDYDNDTFKFYARQAGLKPDSNKEPDKAAVGELKYRYENAIRASQPKTNSEREAILKQLVVSVPVTEKGMLWGTNTKKMPLYKIQSGEQLMQSLRIDPERSKAVLEDLVNANVEITPDRIRALYIKKYGEEPK